MNASDARERLEAVYMEATGAATGHGALAWISRYVAADERTVRRWLEPGGDPARLEGALRLYDEGQRIGRERAVEEIKERIGVTAGRRQRGGR